MTTSCVDLPSNFLELIDAATYKVRINGVCKPCVPSSSKLVCWHDCHPFSHPPVFIPMGVDMATKEWTLRGLFCSLSCLKAFLVDEGVYSRDHQILWAKKFASQYMEVPSIVPRAPSRFVLQMFGGNMSIDEFRTTQHKYLNIRTPIRVRPLEEIAVTLPKKVKMNNKGVQVNMSTMKLERCPKKYQRTKRGFQSGGSLSELMVSYLNVS